jgi:hypothetical protein
MCYNLLLLFPSGFKEFLPAYTPVFFLVFILQEFLEEQYYSLISRTDLIQGECYKYLNGMISTDFFEFPLGHISTTPTSLYVGKSSP